MTWEFCDEQTIQTQSHAVWKKKLWFRWKFKRKNETSPNVKTEAEVCSYGTSTDGVLSTEWSLIGRKFSEKYQKIYLSTSYAKFKKKLYNWTLIQVEQHNNEKDEKTVFIPVGS